MMEYHQSNQIDDWFDKKHHKWCQCQSCRQERNQKLSEGKGEKEQRWGEGAKEWDEERKG